MAGRQVRTSVVSHLATVVLDTEAGELERVDVEYTNVDVLPIQKQLGLLGTHSFGILQQYLVLVALGKSDDFQDCAILGKDLVKHVQGNGAEEVLQDDPDHWALASHRHSDIHRSSRGSQHQVP